MKIVKQRILACSVGALALLGTTGATAQSSAAPLFAPQSSSMPAAAAAVSAFYTARSQPIWLRGGVASPAATQLVNILKRAPFDGLALGPQLAAQVEAALLQAKNGNPQDLLSADRTLSTAWVTYVQAIKQPTRGMIYAYPVLQPQGTRADQILLTAAAAPSLETYVQNVSRVNSLYAQLRDAAWNQAQASGNVTPDPRVLANLDRLRSIPLGGRYIVVDSATQRMFLYENGAPIDSMKVIVGMGTGKAHFLPTPLIASIMYYVTFNPYWNAPDHLIREAIAPKTLKGGMKYFNSMGYEVMADWTSNSAVLPAEGIDWKSVAAGTTKLRIRQKPGKDNFMGVLKFPFPNPEEIYLHDTPAKDKFSLASRDLSNGCVRVEDAKRLGRWLLGRDPVAPGAEPETQVQIPKGMPIYLTYLTAHADNGQLTFVKDIYGWDRPSAQRVASAAQ